MGKNRGTSLNHTRIAKLMVLGLRKQAAMTLEVRSRPDWLLASLILASVMVAEGLPLVLNHILPPNTIWAPFLISSAVVAIFAEIIPQAVMPRYSLEISGRSIWFIKLIMYLTAIPACLLACALKKVRHWQKRQEPNRMDGILDMDELIEFVRLHEQDEDHGGKLTDCAGTLVRNIMEHQLVTVGEEIRPWTSVVLLEATSPITSLTLKRLTDCADPYAVVTIHHGNELSQKLKENGCDEEKNRQGDVKTGISLAGVVLTKVYAIQK